MEMAKRASLCTYTYLTLNLEKILPFQFFLIYAIIFRNGYVKQLINKFLKSSKSLRDDPAFEFRTNTFCINPQRKCSEGRQNMSGLVLAFWRLCLEYARQGVWLPSYFTLNDFFLFHFLGWGGVGDIGVGTSQTSYVFFLWLIGRRFAIVNCFEE